MNRPSRAARQILAFAHKPDKLDLSDEDRDGRQEEAPLFPPSTTNPLLLLSPTSDYYPGAAKRPNPQEPSQQVQISLAASSSSSSAVTPSSAAPKKSSSTSSEPAARRSNPLLYSFISMSQTEKTVGAPRKIVSRTCYSGGGYVDVTTRQKRLWFCFADGELEDIFGSEEQQAASDEVWEGGAQDVVAPSHKKRRNPAKRKKRRKQVKSTIPSFLVYDDEDDAPSSDGGDESEDEEDFIMPDGGRRLYWPAASVVDSGGGSSAAPDAQLQAAPAKRGRGRPPGQKNKSQAEDLQQSNGAARARNMHSESDAMGSSRVSTRGGGRPNSGLYRPFSGEDEEDYTDASDSDESCLSRDEESRPARAVEVFSSHGRELLSRYPTLRDACKGMRVSERVLVNALAQRTKGGSGGGGGSEDEPALLFEQGNHPLKDLLVRWEPVAGDLRGKLHNAAKITAASEWGDSKRRSSDGPGRRVGQTPSRKVRSQRGGGAMANSEDDDDDNTQQTDWWYQQLDNKADSLKSSILRERRKPDQKSYLVDTSRVVAQQDSRGATAVTPSYSFAGVSFGAGGSGGYVPALPQLNTASNYYAGSDASDTVWAAEQVASFASGPSPSSMCQLNPFGRAVFDDTARIRLGLCMVCQIEKASVLYQPCGCCKVCERCERIKETGILAQRCVSDEALARILPFGWCGYCLCDVGARYVAAVDSGEQERRD